MFSREAHEKIRKAVRDERKRREKTRGGGRKRGSDEERRIGRWPIRKRKYERKRYFRRDKSAFN